MHPSASSAGGRRVTRWSRESIVEKIREWNDRYGEPPCAADWNPSLARWRAQEWRAERYREGVWPSTNAVKRPFGGSFVAAVRAAGLEPHKPGPRRRAAGAVRPAVEQRAPRAPRDVEEAVRAAEDRANAAERRAERAEERLSEARRRARRASEREGRARRARDRVLVGAQELRAAVSERDDTLVADAHARARAAEDQTEAAVRDALDARRRAAAAHARAVDAEARAQAAERLLAAARATSAADGDAAAAALHAAAEAEDRAAAAERHARELAALVCGEHRQLKPSELAALRAGGPSGPAVVASALRALHRARAAGDRAALKRALGELAGAAVRWRDRL